MLNQLIWCFKPSIELLEMCFGNFCLVIRDEVYKTFSLEVVGSIPGRGHLVSSKDTSMSLSDCVKLATSKFELEPSRSTF